MSARILSKIQVIQRDLIQTGNHLTFGVAIKLYENTNARKKGTSEKQQKFPIEN